MRRPCRPRFIPPHPGRVLFLFLLLAVGLMLIPPIGRFALTWYLSSAGNCRVELKGCRGSILTGIRVEKVILSRFGDNALSLVVVLQDARFLPASLLGAGELLFARQGRLSSGIIYLSAAPVHIDAFGNMRTGLFRGRLFYPFPPETYFSGDGLQAGPQGGGGEFGFSWEQAEIGFPLSRVSVSGYLARSRFELMLASPSLQMMDVAYMFPFLRTVEPEGKLSLSGSLRGSPSDFAVELMASWNALETRGIHWAAGEAALKGKGELGPEGPSWRARLEVGRGGIRLGGILFSLTRAQAWFRGRRPPDPDLDFAFEGDNGLHRFFLNIGGRLSRPLTEVCSLPPLDKIALASRLSGRPLPLSLPEEEGTKSFGDFLREFSRRLAAGDSDAGRFQVSDIDLAAERTGATVQTRWMNRFSSIYGLTVRPGGADCRLGVQYELTDNLSISNQQTIEVGNDLDEDTSAGDDHRFLLRLQGRF